MGDTLSDARSAQSDPHRNGQGWYSCDCGELIGELADEIQSLRVMVEVMATRLIEVEEVHRRDDGILVWSSCGERIDGNKDT